jgi:hypothetical protein
MPGVCQISPARIDQGPTPRWHTSIAKLSSGYFEFGQDLQSKLSGSEYHSRENNEGNCSVAAYFRFSASNSSSVRGQSEPNNRERLRSASTLPPVWQTGQ